MDIHLKPLSKVEQTVEGSVNGLKLLTQANINTFTAGVDGVCEVVLTLTSVNKILWCDHSNEISLEVLSCGVICFKKFYKMKFGIFVEFAFGHIWQ